MEEQATVSFGNSEAFTSCLPLENNLLEVDSDNVDFGTGVRARPNPLTQADAAAAAGEAAAEDGSVLAVLRHDPHHAHVLLHAAGPLAGLRVVRHRRARARHEPQGVGPG